MNSTNNILEINNISKVYCSKEKEIHALESIAFNVKEKDFVSIVGPSGSGKSTLLNIISNLDKEYDGSIIKKDYVNIGYMLQEDALFDWLTILDNALLGLKISKKLNTNSKNYVLNLLNKYGLTDFIYKYPKDLSGGMRQKVALIRTLATNPDILLLDEPFCSLDYQSRLKLSNDVYNIIKDENITVIMVTHNIEEAVCMSNKIIVLSSRPSIVKNIHNIKLSNSSTLLNNRKDEMFNYYYELIWKEIDV